MKNLPLPECLTEAARRLEQLKSDRFELYFRSQTSTQIEVKDQEVETLVRSQDVGLAVRVIKDRRLGFSFTTSLDRDAVLKAAESALEIAKAMPQDEFVDLIPFGKREYPKLSQESSYDSAGLAVPMAEKIAMARGLETAARGADSRIKAVRNSSIAEHASETHLLDSQGRHLSNQGTLFTAYLTCKAEQDGDSQMGGEFGFSPHLSGIAIESIGKIAAGLATEILGSGSAPTMRCPAVFRNNVIADLVEFLSESFSAEQIDKGRSMLAGKHGQELFSKQFTLIDDGLRAGGYATSPFDGEGTPSTRTILVKQGMISGSLYDTYYARKKGASPTGNAARRVKAPPSISHTNLYLEPGSKTPAQLLDGISKGILLTDLMGVHTANPVTGDFSLGASGILIEDGRLTRPVRGFAVAGNVLEVFRRIVDTGNDLKFFGSIGAPSARVSEISVGGT